MDQTTRVTVHWTQTAKDALLKLPKKVRKGLFEKANELRNCSDPQNAHKPLVGPLKGYNRITYDRYRAIYKCQSETLASGDVHVHIFVYFVAAGIRKEGDKKDVYQFAKRLLALGVLDGIPPAKGKTKK